MAVPNCHICGIPLAPYLVPSRNWAVRGGIVAVVKLKSVVANWFPFIETLKLLSNLTTSSTKPLAPESRETFCVAPPEVLNNSKSAVDDISHSLISKIPSLSSSKSLTLATPSPSESSKTVTVTSATSQRPLASQIWYSKESFPKKSAFGV